MHGAGACSMANLLLLLLLLPECARPQHCRLLLLQQPQVIVCWMDSVACGTGLSLFCCCCCLLLRRGRPLQLSRSLDGSGDLPADDVCSCWAPGSHTLRVRQYAVAPDGCLCTTKHDVRAGQSVIYLPTRRLLLLKLLVKLASKHLLGWRPQRTN
jgi:hypothetical protein